jgi:hypothetical protein
MLNGNFETLLLVFVALTGLAVLLQAVVLLALFLTVRKTAMTLNDQMQELRTTVLPVVTEAKDFLVTVRPKVDSVVADVAELSRSVRAQSADLQEAAAEIMERVRRQTIRVDDMLSSALDAVDRAGGLVSDAVNTPLRQLSAIAAGLKAGLGAFRTGRPEQRQIPAPAGDDTIV